MFTSGIPGYKIQEWLYGDWNEDKYNTYLFLRGMDPTGLVGSYFDYLLDQRADNEYLKNHGMDYSDIHDPRKLRQSSSGSGFYRSTQLLIGKNIDKLYR